MGNINININNNYERVVAEINLDNIAHNIINIKKFLSQETKLMAIVKADGYGHGAIEVAKTCLYNGANFLGVAIIDEALELRNNNIHEPILILGYTKDSRLSLVVEYNITQTIFSYEMAKKLSKEAVILNKKVNVHIKIDTGMGRLGFYPNEDTVKEIIKISKLKFIKITGIFTHFANADNIDKSFTIEQIKRFNNLLELLKNNKFDFNNIDIHASNSGGILDFNKLSNRFNFNFNMVRAGIIIYGLYPSEYVEKSISLKPAMSLKTHISFIKEVEANTSISYGSTYITNKKSKIASIPVGYADGYARCLSNKARVIINGYYCNVIGRICMDQFMVDVTHIEDVKIEDNVILMGSNNFNNNFNISVEELANLQGTINYEIVCNIGKRVPRVFIKNNKKLKLKK